MRIRASLPGAYGLTIADCGLRIEDAPSASLRNPKSAIRDPQFLRPLEALADERRSFKPWKQVQFLTGGPSALLHFCRSTSEALADERRSLKPQNQVQFLTGVPKNISRAASSRPPFMGGLGASPAREKHSGSVAKPADAAASRAVAPPGALEVRILPEPPISRARGGTSRHGRLRSGRPPGVQVQLLPGPPVQPAPRRPPPPQGSLPAGGQAQSPRVSHKHASSVQLGVPHP